MNETAFCPRCGNRLPEASPLGAVCPSCMLAGGLATGPNVDPAPTAAMGADWEPPDIASLQAALPQYRIGEMLGRGGMGAIYRAEQTSLGREVAIKVMSPKLSNHGDFAERFAREARALAKLAHPGIVSVHDFGRVDDLCYLVMEYIDGVNLRQAIQAETIEPEQALNIVGQVCDALQYAHGQGIVHRDIKPENILLDRNGRVKLADFGLAKLVNTLDSKLTLTAANQVMGTLHYMAPEQLERPLEVDHRADIFSLGVVIYELLTGHLPLGRFKLPSEHGGSDAALDQVVLKTLERLPDDRYQNVSQVSEAIQNVSRGGGTAGPAEAIHPDRHGNPTQTSIYVPVTESKFDRGMLMTGIFLCVIGPGLIIHGLLNNFPTQFIGIGISINGFIFLGSSLPNVTKSARRMLTSPNVGMIVHGLAMIWAGAILWPGGFDSPFGWVGMGLILGGGYVLLPTWQAPKRNRRVRRWRHPDPGTLLLSAGFIIIGSALMGFGILFRREEVIWIGLGLTLGGGGIGNAAWAEKRSTES